MEGMGRKQGWVEGRVKMGSRKMTFISGKPLTFAFLHHAVTI